MDAAQPLQFSGCPEKGYLSAKNIFLVFVRWDSIFMITVISSQNLGVSILKQHSVPKESRRQPFQCAMCSIKKCNRSRNSIAIQCNAINRYLVLKIKAIQYCQNRKLKQFVSNSKPISNGKFLGPSNKLHILQLVCSMYYFLTLELHITFKCLEFLSI